MNIHLSPRFMSFGTPRGRHAFTLIELLTVIAIIGILAGIMIPVVSRVRETARGVRCTTNLRTIHQALTLFAEEHQGKFPSIYAPLPPNFPSAISWWTVLQWSQNPRYETPRAGDSSNGNWYYCPAAEKSYPIAVRRAYSMNNYGMLEANPIYPAKSSSWSQTLLVADGSHDSGGDSMLRFRNSSEGTLSYQQRLDPRHGGKINGVFLDGHVERFPLSHPSLETWTTNLNN